MCPSVRISRSIFVLLLCLTACADERPAGLGQEVVQGDEQAIERDMVVLIKEISLERQSSDAKGLMRRFNQVKTLGCATGEMQVNAPASHSVGLFATSSTYPVTLRFANATELDDGEADFRGLSLRVHSVPGATGAGGIPNVQDFTMNNHPALVAGTPEDFLDFIRASKGGTLAMLWFLATHPGSIPIVLGGRDNHTSPLAVTYYSTTPSRFGAGVAMKYSVAPCDPPGTRVAADHDDYLRDALQHDVSATAFCLNFRVQLQTDAELMPIEDASVEWPEELSPYVTVAKITLPAQQVTDPAQLEQCERMLFNPWSTLAEHQPLGGINRVRKNLYTEIGRFRSQHNGE